MAGNIRRMRNIHAAAEAFARHRKIAVMARAGQSLRGDWFTMRCCIEPTKGTRHGVVSGNRYISDDKCPMTGTMRGAQHNIPSRIVDFLAAQL